MSFPRRRESTIFSNRRLALRLTPQREMALDSRATGLYRPRTCCRMMTTPPRSVVPMTHPMTQSTAGPGRPRWSTFPALALLVLLALLGAGRRRGVRSDGRGGPGGTDRERIRARRNRRRDGFAHEEGAQGVPELGRAASHRGDRCRDQGGPRTGPAAPRLDTGSGCVHTGSGYVHTGSGYVHTGSGYVRTGSGYVRTGSGYVRTGSGYVRTGSGYAHNVTGCVHTGAHSRVRYRS